MRVLIGCEFSGRVREAFRPYCDFVLSCDLLPTEIKGNHYQGNIKDILYDGWDLLIAFPPCTFLCSSGMHWNSRRPERVKQTKKALDFFDMLVNAPIEKIAIENPVGILSSHYRKPDQVIQPFQFGDDAAKATCLWLKNLPTLQPTQYIEPRLINGKPRWANQTDSGQNKLGPSKTRAKVRSLTYNGIAKAMASQWSKPCFVQMGLF
tara:strand:- start:856 stop:1476 length:621 start_codon:yes stop_codon:yes gene_type:complete